MAKYTSSNDALVVRRTLLMKEVENDQQIQRDRIARYEREAASMLPAERASVLSAIANEIRQLRAEGFGSSEPSEAWASECERKGSELIVRAIAFGAFQSAPDATLRANVERAYITYPPDNCSYQYQGAECAFVAAARELLNRVQNPPATRTYLDGLQAIADEIERASAATESDGNGRLDTIDESNAALSDDAWMTHTDIAKHHGVDAESLRKRLDRYRAKNHNGWREVDGARPNEPKYLYCYGAVKSIVEKLKASGKTSGQRPAK